MIDDAVFLARIQFAFTMAFHIIFPSFTISLVAWIATLEAMWLSTGRDRHYLLARFGTKIFAVSFAMSVVSGLSIFPYAVPRTITIYAAAAPPASSIFGLMGVLFVLPQVLVYTAFVYWTFRGKVLPGEGYH
jgi:cytochrome bd-type quinol oxidase subunit 2